MSNVPSNRDAASLLVNGTINVVGSELLKASSCRMMAGRSPVCACPGAGGMRTRHTSPLFIAFHLFRQAFDHFERAPARSLPGVEFLLQLRRHFDWSADDMDLHERPFRQRRVGHDNPVLDEARNNGRHDVALLKSVAAIVADL